MASPILRYRAGPTARKRLLREGLRPEVLGALMGPASGPRWLVLAGLDMALYSSGLLNAQSEEPLLLAGSSAGAWRMASLASRDPEATHERLAEGYIGHRFHRGDTPRSVTQAYREMLWEVFPAADIEHILTQPHFELAMHALRSRRLLDPLPERARALAMVKASILTGFSYRAAALLGERVLFCHAPSGLRSSFRGAVVSLDQRSFYPAALATASMPIYLEPQWNIPGAPPGPCYDGGISDYQLRHDYLRERKDSGTLEKIVLMPHYQDRVDRAWWPSWARRPSENLLDNLFLIHPTEVFLRRLPDARLPDVADFKSFVDHPEGRIRRWRQVVRLGQRLGEQFLSDLERGNLEEKIEPL